MSAPNISSLIVPSQQVYIYMGIPIFVTGVIGSLLNTIVFLSLRTFRESSCAFYLTVMAIVNIGHLSTTFFSRIMISGFGIDWTLMSTFYCKFRIVCGTVCTSTSFTCMCLATIDQFLATCKSPRWQQWSNIKVAHHATVISIIIWLSHAVPIWFYYGLFISPITGKYTCMCLNPLYQQYYSRIYTVVFIGFLPIFVNTLFGLLAYYNINHLAYRTVPLVRRELDKQLTSIVLTHTLFAFFAVVPYIIIAILSLDPNIMGNPVIADRVRFANALALCMYYSNFASPFYVNICASGRFRQQFIYVIFKIYINRWRQRLVVVNQIAPHT